ncbi:MAG: methyltransferase domain-containing protein [Planctomycetales bacterium]|nr:methyltransferase domain-containing protein [Planctomycetales bacterium]
MDDPDLDANEHIAALGGLRRIHALSGTLGRFWRPLQQLIQPDQLRHLSVMDVGCGDSLLLRQLYRKSQQHDCTLHLIGCDFSARALELSRQACQREEVPIDLHQVDVTRQALPATADVVINSLFLHHFDSSDVVHILASMATAARRLVLIEDLLRSRLGYVLCWAGVRLLTRSRVVHFDGPLSVRAAFTMQEINGLLNQAHWTGAQLVRRWPERFLILYRPHQTAADFDHSTRRLWCEPHGA